MMASVVTWRGQVPAWQCDSDGRWNIRHVTGAFDEARQVAGQQGPVTGTMGLTTGDGALPVAGDLVEIHSAHTDGVLAQTLVEVRSGRKVLSAAIACDRAPDVAPIHLEAGIPGPLNLVNAWECDVMGHMNVQFYAARLTEVEAFLAAGLGLDGDGIVRPMEHRLRFSGELLADDIASAGIVTIGQSEQLILSRTELRSARGLSAVMESDLVALSPAGDAIDLPLRLGDDINASSSDDSARPVWSGGDWSPDAGTLARMTVLGRQEVASWEVDHTGVMPPRFFFARMASSVPFLMSDMGLTRPFMQAHGLGRAAVGYRLRYLRWPRAGDCLELRSGVAVVGEKNWRFRHAFVDVADGGLVSFVEAVIVLLDLAARKSVPLPDGIRQRAMVISL
jgi:acyl-CoA thioester hydrolase